MKRAEACPESAEGLSASLTKLVLSVAKDRGLCRDAVLGLSKIAKVIDTPVKRYSTGMYVRLAFAVAAQW